MDVKQCMIVDLERRGDKRMFITEQVASISEKRNGLWAVRCLSSLRVFNYKPFQIALSHAFGSMRCWRKGAACQEQAYYGCKWVASLHRWSAYFLLSDLRQPSTVHKYQGRECDIIISPLAMWTSWFITPLLIVRFKQRSWRLAFFIKGVKSNIRVMPSKTGYSRSLDYVRIVFPQRIRWMRKR